MARNNQRRTQTTSKKTTKTEEPAVTTTTSVLDFVTPTHVVDLPSKGRFYAASHPLHNQETIEIRYMTAKDEDILTSPSLLKKGLVIDRLLKSVLLNKTLDPGTLLIGDRNALIVAARTTGYGETYETNVTCPACGDTQKHTFNLENPGTYEGDEWDDMDITATEDGTFLVMLPLTKVEAEIRLLTGNDETRIAQSVARNKKRNILESNLTTQFSHAIISLNGEDDRKVIDHFAQMMPAFDARYLRNAFQLVTPNIDLKQDYACSACEHEQEMELPFTADFFWPNR